MIGTLIELHDLSQTARALLNVHQAAHMIPELE
jgi:hypothetical protein